MFDVMPYWMWAVSLLLLALVCGAALSAGDARRPARNAWPRTPGAQRTRRPSR